MRALVSIGEMRARRAGRARPWREAAGVSGMVMEISEMKITIRTIEDADSKDFPNAKGIAYTYDSAYDFVTSLRKNEIAALQEVVRLIRERISKDFRSE